MSDVPGADEIPESERGDTADHNVPTDLVQLHEMVEWQEALNQGPNGGGA